jgi:hypothetical protein
MRSRSLEHHVGILQHVEQNAVADCEQRISRVLRKLSERHVLEASVFWVATVFTTLVGKP